MRARLAEEREEEEEEEERGRAWKVDEEDWWGRVGDTLRACGAGLLRLRLPSMLDGERREEGEGGVPVSTGEAGQERVDEDDEEQVDEGEGEAEVMVGEGDSPSDTTSSSMVEKIDHSSTELLAPSLEGGECLLRRWIHCPRSLWVRAEGRA